MLVEILVLFNRGYKICPSQPSTTLGYDVCVHFWTYYYASYVYQLYFRFAYFLDESEGGGPV